MTQFLSILRKYQDVPPQPDVDSLRAAQKRFLAATAHWAALPTQLPRLFNSQAGKARVIEESSGAVAAVDDQTYFYFRPSNEKEDLPLATQLDGQTPPPFFANALFLHMELIVTPVGGATGASASAVTTFPVNPQVYAKAVLRLILHSLPDRTSTSPRTAASAQAAGKYISQVFGALRTKVQEVIRIRYYMSVCTCYLYLYICNGVL